MQPSDRQLLDRYLAGNDETAFRLLLERYLPLVHGVARRVTRSEEFARDVSQAVFLRLARRAALIPSGLSLVAWLHRSTHSLAASLVRGEERRKKRERLAAEMNANDGLPQTPGWDVLAPVIDRLVDELPGTDREIVLARFYRGEPHAAIAARLGLSEVLVRKRTARALEKLRAMLGKRGIATTSSALATLLPANAATSPAPAALAGLILQSAHVVTPLVPNGLQAALIVMNATQKSLIVAAAAVFIASFGYAVRPAATSVSDISPVRRGISAVQSSVAARSLVSRGKVMISTTAEGRREQLEQIFAIRNALTRRREMLAFASQLQPDHFEDLYAASYKDYDFRPSESRKVGVGPELKILTAAWATKDPGGALAALKSDRIPASFSSTLAFALGACHPQDAVEWAKDLKHPHFMLGGLASVDLPTAVEAMLEGVPEERRAGTLGGLYSRLRNEPDILARLAALARPGPERTALLLKVADEEAQMSPSISVVRQVMSDPEALRRADVERLFQHLSATDPEAATAALQDLPPGPVRGRALSGAAGIVARKNLDAAIALLDRYPEESGDKLVAEVVNWGASRNPGGAIAHLERIHDSEMRESEQLRHFQQWRLKDPDAARAWIAANGTALPETVQRELQAPPQSQGLDFRSLDSP